MIDWIPQGVNEVFNCLFIDDVFLVFPDVDFDLLSRAQLEVIWNIFDSSNSLTIELQGLCSFIKRKNIKNRVFRNLPLLSPAVILRIAIIGVMAVITNINFGLIFKVFKGFPKSLNIFGY